MSEQRSMSRSTFLVTNLVVAALLSGCGAQEETAGPRLRLVRHIVAQSQAAVRSRTFSGTSRSSQESRLSFKVSGTLEALPIRVGDTLSRGDLIARVDASQYELEAQQAQAGLVQAQAAERNAEATYERTKGLYENQTASRGDLDSARANAESAKAQAEVTRKQLELARLNVAYTRLRAVEECSVATVEVEVNENVSAGSTVALVNCGDELEVGLSMPESLIGGIEEGMRTAIRFDALPDETFTGTVTEVGVAARSGTTFPVTVRVDGTHSQLRSGLAAEVILQFRGSGEKEVILVPLTAVVHEPGGNFVFLVEPESDDEAMVVRREVELGELTADGMEIVGGLSPGERVITAGTSVVRQGLRVRFEPVAPSPEQAAPATAADAEAGQ